MAEIEVRRYDFSPEVVDQIEEEYFVKQLWPVVYILSDGSQNQAYVGETTNALARFQTHLKHSEKAKLTSVHLIESGKFNKSAALDIEANLIRYMSGEGRYRLLNSNIGIANHNYYQKDDLYWSMFEGLWNELIREGIAEKSLAEITNSDLFKYSPYKALSHDQVTSMIQIMESLLNDSSNTILIEGGAGTGKTVLATYLFKLLHSHPSEFSDEEFGEDHGEIFQLARDLKLKYRNPRTALVVPMSSFRSTMKKVFKSVKGLKASMVIGPAELAKQSYDILIVDEAHRLRRRKNIVNYASFDGASKALGLDKMKTHELEWVLKRGERQILFYDAYQSIRPSDVPSSEFDRIRQDSKNDNIKLKTQFRVAAGDDYVEFVQKLLNDRAEYPTASISDKYELLLFDDIKAFRNQVIERNTKFGLSRMIAGFSWRWKTKNADGFDIEIEGTKLRWNSTTSDWINSPKSINEVGCIHTSQGYDLNYTGLIFGEEITYNHKKGKIEILPENYFDSNGKKGIEDPERLKEYILNIYQTMMLRGIRGTFIYACDASFRKYLEQYIPVHEKKSAFKVLSWDEVRPYENAIPKYDLKIAAGDFSPPQQEEDVEWVQLDNPKYIGRDYFVCQVQGESMNQKVPSGSWCLFRRYSGGSRNGEIVLAQHHSFGDEGFGSGYTLKEYRSEKRISEAGWEHTSIQLIPHSDDSRFEPIKLAGSELETFGVVGVLVGVL